MLHERRDVSYRRHLDHLLSSLFRLTPKKESRRRITFFARGIQRWPADSPRIGPLITEAVSMTWRHHVSRNGGRGSGTYLVKDNVNYGNLRQNQTALYTLSAKHISWYLKCPLHVNILNFKTGAMRTVFILQAPNTPTVIQISSRPFIYNITFGSV